jgi:hypothetical protein
MLAYIGGRVSNIANGINIVHGKRNLPCVLKEIMLYLFQLASCAHMSPEFGERGNVGVVRRPVAPFVPIGHSTCALAPLTDAALYLVNSWHAVSI